MSQGRGKVGVGRDGSVCILPGQMRQEALPFSGPLLSHLKNEQSEVCMGAGVGWGRSAVMVAKGRDRVLPLGGQGYALGPESSRQLVVAHGFQGVPRVVSLTLAPVG